MLLEYSEELLDKAFWKKKKNSFHSKQQLGHAVSLLCFTIAFWKDLRISVNQKWI